jgi:sulfur carrier protein
VITVTANGRAVELPEGATLSALLATLGVPPQAVAAMEHNGVPVPRSDHQTRLLSEGDRVELVRAVAGGC